MPYAPKQYDAALQFMPGSTANIPSQWDNWRIQAYDLYENIYINSVQNLKIVLRGSDTNPILMPSGRKIIEATNRFLGQGFDYFVEPTGDEGTRQTVEDYLKKFWKRECVPTKFGSCKRWGLIRGDGLLMIYAVTEKPSGNRVCLKEINPRMVFEIEDVYGDCIGLHIVDLVHDFRTTTKNKMINRRRTFRKVFDATNQCIGITSELTHWELGKWDDRDPTMFDPKQQVRGTG